MVSEQGTAVLRLEIPRPIWEAVGSFAKLLNISAEKALDLLLLRVSALIEQGDSAFLGPEWQKATASAKADNFNVLEGPKIDLTKLHRNPKAKSGYVGVYTNGKGFRAMGADPGTRLPIYLGTRDNPEAAAWLRYQHYKKHELPYGELELEIQKYRDEYHDTRPEADIIKDIREESQRLGYFHVIFPDEVKAPT